MMSLDVVPGDFGEDGEYRISFIAESAPFASRTFIGVGIFIVAILIVMRLGQYKCARQPKVALVGHCSSASQRDSVLKGSFNCDRLRSFASRTHARTSGGTSTKT